MEQRSVFPFTAPEFNLGEREWTPKQWFFSENSHLLCQLRVNPYPYSSSPCCTLIMHNLEGKGAEISSVSSGICCISQHECNA